VKFIASHRSRFGVEPICRVLEVAPSTYYAAAARPLSARRQEDERLKPEVSRVHAQNLDVYGVRKVWRQMHREGFSAGRDRIARLMRELHLAGARRGKRSGGPPSRTPWLHGPPIWSTGNSRPAPRTGSGWPT
jgi:putative transposase